MSNLMVNDNWLTDIFNKPVYKINIDQKVTQSDLKSEMSHHKQGFFYAKVDVADILLVKTFEGLGFHLVDTNIVFKKNVAGNHALFSSVTIRLARPQDKELVIDLAQSYMTRSRFHLDPAIPKVTANKVKRHWMENYFLDKRGDFLVVAEANAEIIGFNLLLDNKSLNQLTIDLIAVKPDYQGTGVAQDLVGFAENHCPNAKEYLVGTQLSNVRSIRFYEKVGFKFFKAQYVFHLHR